MNKFYLNDCLGNHHIACDVLSDGLVHLIKAFRQLSENAKLRVAKGWILEKEPSSIVLAGVSLGDVVKGMKNKDCRTLFYVYATKYPIHKYFDIDSEAEDELLSCNYMFDGQDAINSLIVYRNNGVLMSLPVTSALKNDFLNITSEKGSSLLIPNLHGANDANIIQIRRVLLDRNYEKSKGIEKIRYLAPVVEYTKIFEKQFNNLTEENIQSIFERFDEVRRNNMLFPVICNGTLIKHVAPKVFELRVVNPVDIRIYFYEHKETLIFAKIAFKSDYHGRDQSDDIIDSGNMIENFCHSF